MRTIELVSGISSSALGFGCAPILGSVDATTAQRALDCALDHGITHFDLARSYGYGQAEHFVGKSIVGRRDKVVLASKFGIKANWKASFLRPLKPLVRLIKDKQKKEGKLVTNTANNPNSIADHFHDRIPLHSNTMRSSLEQSLRALGTDYLDYFFVHEPLQTLDYIDELSDTAQRLKEEGKIKAWGLAFARSQERLHQTYLNRFDILQFDNAFGASGYDKTVKERGKEPNIFFSPLRGGKVGVTPQEKLGKLFEDFPQSVILCSMFNERHIKENIKLV
ncbi:aldo/keto reductase [Spirosoma sp. KCTC 42546]|uniref:aldo/keto reductase n=1 Tax=Spirosoma sp. KCTC 42546 TaxID=2520506 RepID=UPI00115A3E72|nr:aldo/keto reductase [Spirosoma sp. KCTC 42546]QDK78666.1 aldo/keto reductase [Spirosoma sp. KCTC 42546]